MKEIDNENCCNCKWLEYYEDCNSDGYVNELNSGYVCNGSHPGMENLKGFPFYRKQKCWEKEISCD